MPYTPGVKYPSYLPSRDSMVVDYVRWEITAPLLWANHYKNIQ